MTVDEMRGDLISEHTSVGKNWKGLAHTDNPLTRSPRFRCFLYKGSNCSCLEYLWAKEGICRSEIKVGEGMLGPSGKNASLVFSREGIRY